MEKNQNDSRNQQPDSKSNQKRGYGASKKETDPNNPIAEAGKGKSSDEKKSGEEGKVGSKNGNSGNTGGGKSGDSQRRG